MCADERALANFLLATTHAKVANSGKVVIAHYHIHYFFKK